MSIFKIETNEVESSAENIKAITNNIEKIINQVENYDVTCEDDDIFDFKSIKDLILNNLEACRIKTRNTSNILDVTSQEHTLLQSKLIYKNNSITNDK